MEGGNDEDLCYSDTKSCMIGGNKDNLMVKPDRKKENQQKTGNYEKYGENWEMFEVEWIEFGAIRTKLKTF